jgi:hypothetical protein
MLQTTKKLLSATAILLLFSLPQLMAKDAPANLQKLYDKADMQFSSYNFENALNAYQQIIEQDQGQAKALWRASVCLSYVDKNSSAQRADYKRFHKAVRYADQALDAGGNKADAYYAKTLALYKFAEEMGDQSFLKGYDKLSTLADAGLELEPDHSGLNYLKGAILLQRAQLLERVANSQSDSESQAQVTQLLAASQKHLTKAVTLNPDRVNYRYDLALVQMEMDNQDLAEQQFRSIMALEPLNHEEAKHLEQTRRMLNQKDGDLSTAKQITTK